MIFLLILLAAAQASPIVDKSEHFPGKYKAAEVTIDNAGRVGIDLDPTNWPIDPKISIKVDLYLDDVWQCGAIFRGMVIPIGERPGFNCGQGNKKLSGKMTVEYEIIGGPINTKMDAIVK